MREFIKVAPEPDGNYTNYNFIDGPYKGRTAFSVLTEVDGAQFVANQGVFETYVRVEGLSRMKLVVFDAFEVVQPKPKNTIEVKASCGQEMTIELDDIDDSQPIRDVTIRGVVYVPK